MNEFVKLTWRKNVTDEDLEQHFLSEEAASDCYIFKSFNKPLRVQPKKKVKLHLAKEKHVPGLKYYHLIRRRSLLTKAQKRHCLAAVKLLQSGKKHDLLTEREKYGLKLYNECQPKILEENRNFLEHVKNIWMKHKDKRLRTKKGIYNYSWENLKRSIARYLDYPQYYQEVCTVCLNYDESEATVDFQHVGLALETGTLARFAHPNLKEPTLLRLNVLQKISDSVLVNSKLPVSQDENIPKLLQNHKFDIVISSSGLKQIIDYTNTRTKWIIPVVVKEIEINNSDGGISKKKIVFVDKVLPKVNPSISDLNYYAYKRLLKLNFCQYEAFNYPFEETPIETETAVEPKESGEDNTEAPVAENTEDGTIVQTKNRTIHHNVNYRTWNVKKTTSQNTLMKNQIKDEEINLLVRCKLDACEDAEGGVLYPVVVRPKIEQQLQYGANVASKSELARDWTTLFFRLYSNLYRARIYSPMSEIISVEKCTIQKVFSEAVTQHDYKPILGLGVLQKVLSELVKLNCGNYILQHLPKHESFVSVMKQCNDDTANAFNLHAECEETGVDFQARQNWLPIDVNYILPAHENHNQIPAVFHGFDVDIAQGLNRKSVSIVVGAQRTNSLS
jgi:hypothetical protein